jgi:hypothetical protein
LDVHIKLDEGVREYVEGELARQIRTLCPHTDIDFNSSAVPHATLYLTSFVRARLDAVVRALDALMPTLPARCAYAMDAPQLSGQYFMWGVAISPCLQLLSDAVVNATYEWHDYTMPVPAWVYNISDPAARDEMIAYCKTYGSPGVFRQFSPHVTLAWDDVDDMRPLLALSYPRMKAVATTIALGVVGPHGTVLRGKDIKQWKIGGGGH